MTRRQALGYLSFGASVITADSSTSDVTAIVKRHDTVVEDMLARQITDVRSRGYGSLPSANSATNDIEIYAARSAATIVEALTAAYLHPESKFHGNNALIDRMRLATGFLNRIQHPDGCIDYQETNFDSPPDTAFTVQNLASGACLAQRANERELFALSEPFLRKAAEGLVVGGVHTPNHRWVVSSALAQINELFPDPRYVRRIDQWLAEGVDIDEDGQFMERSTSVYNIICDRAFIVLSEKLKRPELLEPARRNLQAMLYLVHADYEVVTEISNRQDRNQRATMGGYWFPLRYLAARDHNGQFATLANKFTPAYSSLSDVMEYPELAGPMPASETLPSDFRRKMGALGIVRFRRDAMSATVLSENPIFFTLRNGSVVIQAVRYATAFFGKGQFLGSEVGRHQEGIVLSQSLEAPYYQPLNPSRKVTPRNWTDLRKERATSQVCRLTQTARVVQDPKGFQLRLQAQGTAGVPVAVEISFREGGEVGGCERLAAQSWLLSGETGSYSAGSDRIRFGPGLCEHRYTQLRGALPRIEGQTVYLTGFTPFDHTVHFEL